MENKTISKQIAKILQLCYQINHEETCRDITGNLPTVFLDFMGHTCQLNIRIYADGWMSGEDPDFSGKVYLDESPNDVSVELAKLIDRLGVTLKLKARKERKRNNAEM